MFHSSHTSLPGTPVQDERGAVPQPGSAAASRRTGLAVRAALLAATVVTALGATAPALADLSVARPVNQLFRADDSRLSPAGERWLRGQVAQSARQPDQMVVVQVPGATPALQRQRGEAIRQRLAAMGVSPRQVYIEAAPEEHERVAGF